MSLRYGAVFGFCALALTACAVEEPPIEEIIVDPVEEGDAADEGPVEVIPALEQCDAADYRPMIGTPVAAATFPQDDMLRIYAVNDIITQEYLPQRTNIVVGLDGLIQRVTCG